MSPFVWFDGLCGAASRDDVAVVHGPLLPSLKFRPAPATFQRRLLLRPAAGGDLETALQIARDFGFMVRQAQSPSRSDLVSFLRSLYSFSKSPTKLNHEKNRKRCTDESRHGRFLPFLIKTSVPR
jgi:hypothetical protein